MHTTATDDQPAAKLAPDYSDQVSPQPPPAAKASGPIALTLDLGGRRYPIPAKFSGQNRPWREKCQAYAAPIQDMLSLLSSAKGETWSQSFAALDTSDIAQTAKAALPMLIGSVDEAIDLLLSYDPILSDDREYLLAHCYDEDLIAALFELIKAVYPVKKLGRIAG